MWVNSEFIFDNLLRIRHDRDKKAMDMLRDILTESEKKQFDHNHTEFCKKMKGNFLIVIGSDFEIVRVERITKSKGRLLTVKKWIYHLYLRITKNK